MGWQVKSSALQHGLYARDDEQHLRQKVRDRAQQTVQDPFVLKTVVRRENGRAAIRELNQTIGMKAYELVGYVLLNNDLLEVEAIVPGRDLALMLKLKYGGT